MSGPGILGVAALVACGAVAAGTTTAGVVVTAAGRHDGPLAPAAGALRAGERDIPWAEVLLAVNDQHPEKRLGAERVHFVDGGSLRADAKLAGGKLTLDSPVVGSLGVELATVAAIDFAVSAAADAGGAEGVLERRSAGPLPCSLVWIRGDRVGIRSVVGAAALEKRDLVRYVFPAPADAGPAAPADEVTLVDGSVVRGAIEMEPDGLRVRSAALGDVKVPHDAWQSLWRGGSARCALLALMEPREVRRFPLIRRLADGPSAERARPGSAEGFVQRVVVRPRSIVVYDVPGEPGETFVFNAGMWLMDGSRGGLRVAIAVDDRMVVDRVLEPDAAEPVPVSIEAPGGGRLSIEVDFGELVRLPAGVVLDDAMFLLKPVP